MLAKPNPITDNITCGQRVTVQLARKRSSRLAGNRNQWPMKTTPSIKRRSKSCRTASDPDSPLGAPSPPRSIQDKRLIAISESRKPRRNSVRYVVNAGYSVVALRGEGTRDLSRRIDWGRDGWLRPARHAGGRPKSPYRALIGLTSRLSRESLSGPPNGVRRTGSKNAQEEVPRLSHDMSLR
jgi:hypothetical protein